jgi:ACDE family multidrug resistance protein
MSDTPSQGRLLHDTNLYLIFLITLFAVMGVASIAPAFPQIIRYFHISEKQVGWLIAAFTLPGIFLTPVMGVLADRLGRKNILVPSLFLFALAGFTCMFIRDFEWLIAVRFLQGIGAASLGSLNITLIGDLYSGQQRVRAMGYNASVLSIGTASYPAIGGLLGVPLGILVLMKLKNPEPDSRQPLIKYISNTVRIINQKSVWGLLIVNTLVFFLIYGAYLTYLPLLLESRMHSNSFFIGLVMSLTSGTTAITSASIGRINRLLKSRHILILGISFYFLAMLFYSFSYSYHFIILPAMLFGLGHGMFVPTVQTLLVGFAPLKERAAFMSVNSMVLRLGQTIGPLVIGLAYGLGGISYAFFGGCVVAVVMLGCVLLLVKSTSNT